MDHSQTLQINPQTRHNFFNSPATPGAVSKLSLYTYNSGRTPEATHYSNSQRPNTFSRKRSRNDSYDISTPNPIGAESPTPFANMNYRLAKGVETPTVITSQYSIDDSSTPELSFRRGRSYTATIAPNGDYFHNHVGEFLSELPGKDGNGRAPVMANVQQQSTWGSMMFNFAGKVWSFCTTNFRGFYAGGGQGYSMKTGHSKPLPNLHSQSRDPEESQWVNIGSTDGPDTIEIHASKKAKKSHNPDDEWEYIRAPSRSTSPFVSSYRASSPSPFIQRPSSPSLSTYTSPSRVLSNASAASMRREQHTTRPTANLRRTISSRPASAAGLRSPSSIPRPSHLQGVSHRRRESLNTKIQSNNHQERKPAPAMDPLITSTIQKDAQSTDTMLSHQTQPESPIAKETRRHIANIKRKEKEEDREIMLMNKYVQDMIRQGQQALGTRIEVDYESDGG
jgi:hypothetical protein